MSIIIGWTVIVLAALVIVSITALAAHNIRYFREEEHISFVKSNGSINGTKANGNGARPSVPH